MTFTIDISETTLWICGIAAYFIVSGCIYFFCVPSLRQDWKTMLFLFIFAPLGIIFMAIPRYGYEIIVHYLNGLRNGIDRKCKRVFPMNGVGRFHTTDIHNIRTVYEKPDKHTIIRPHWYELRDGKWELSDEDIKNHLSGYREFDPETIISVVRRMEKHSDEV